MSSNDEVLTITNEIREALDKAGRLLSQVRDNRLYEKIGYGSFSRYIAGEFSEQFSRSTAYRWMQTAEKNELLANEKASMSQNAAQVLNQQPEALQVVIAKTAAKRADGNQVTARDVTVVAEVVGQMVATGHVDTGNGMMHAVEAALTQEEHEIGMRQRQHIEERSKWRTVYTTEIHNFGGAVDWKEDLYFKDVKIIVQELVVD